MTTPVPSPDDWLSAVVSSHQRLAGTVGRLTADEVAGPSYASEWSIAQVLSHLGSGAEIFELFLRAGLDGDPPPGMTEFEPMWARWNAKDPAAQAADALVADRQFLDRLEGLDEQVRQAWHLNMFGGDQRLEDLLRLRLGEHALHAWDVTVVQDPTATLAPEAVELLVDTVGQLVARVGRSTEGEIRVPVGTTEPARQFLLVADGEQAELQPVGKVTPDTTDGAVKLPAEAFIRLVYGRLDPQHTPAFDGDATVLDSLRRVFPGF
jgi:uncharacterized protein (TIGR03083 family)